MKRIVLPFWAAAGRDPVTGLFQERLLSNGAPDTDAVLRVRVQARQIYVYAHAAVIGWYPEGAALALGAYDRMVSVAYSPDGKGGFVHSVTPGGHVVSPLRDAYDHAFLVLALAWLLRATGEARIRTVLDALLGFVDAEMTAPDGSLLEGIPPSLPRRQNPQMHWYEAMLALMEAGFPGAAERAARHRALFETRLYHAATGSLGEYFTDDWEPVPGLEGAILEPGHHAEWVWLLRRHEALAGLSRSPAAERLLDGAMRWVEPETGLLVDEVLRGGGVHRGTRRTWLQTELAKAWLSEVELGTTGAAEQARRALVTLDRHFLRQPIQAGWLDRIDERGRPLPSLIPASALYHIFLAAAEAERVLGGGDRARA
ncbi:AGE family epimerase/isomerase [Belnapia sp. T18]|uniref:AGE family epimerase/isomerase n=1 Tax=Belnapia arida TaxID=2804533 RepID=A0ABS1UDL5_9PROT|nr:AGE family epimerase/isomerase [Belnapia arida]MBL6082776.1 AGE family epimerase/isomerase [Belnapia arida]